MQYILVDRPSIDIYFNIDIPICVICFKIGSNPKIGRSTRMHCTY